MRRDKSNYTIQAVAHAIDVLEQFEGTEDELGVTELSKRLKLHKNNIFRLLATLEARGYIEQNPATENYRLGIRCLQLGQAYMNRMGLLRQARPILADLVHHARETVYVALRRGNGVVPVLVSEAERTVRVLSPLGRIFPAYCTAAGKALLAFEPDDEQRALAPEPFTKFTERTPPDRTTLMQHLKSVVSGGYAIDMGEHQEDVRGVAVPIRDYTRAVVAALALVGPAYRFQAERIEKELAPLVLRAGRELSSRLGWDAGRRDG